MPLRRNLLLAGLAWPAAASAQPRFPDHPIRLIVPFAPGTSSDMQARLVAIGLADWFGQPVIPETRAGAGGMVGAELVARAPPDGHTLLLGSNGPLTINPVIHPRITYDAEAELAPIALLSRSPLTLTVRRDGPFRSVADLVAAARGRPEEITIGSSGQGSATHFLIEQFMAAAGVRLVHVAYRGSSLSVPDVIAGNVDAVMAELATVAPTWRGGLTRILATTGPARSPLAPGIATLAEQGYPGLIGSSWAALMAPGGTPRRIILELAIGAGAALANEDYAKRQAEIGAELAEAELRMPAGLAAWLRAERARNRATAERAGIRLE
jgi:tripartite-type tricarboxylate transporter receptor subunit TctC